MINLTPAKLKVLQELKDYFYYSANSEIRKKWRLQYDQNLKFYYGDQWNDELKQEFADVGAMPFVVNRIEPIVTTYTSLQIAARKRIAYKATTSLSKHDLLAEYLNNMLYVIQSQNDFQNKSTQKYTDALIGGLGWSHFGYEPDSTCTFFYDYVDPREIYFDPDDQSARMEDSQFVARSYFVNGTKLKKRYPKYSEYFDNLIGKPAGTNSTGEFASGGAGAIRDDYVPYSDLNHGDGLEELWVLGRSARIVEVYYKKNVKYYEAIVAFPPENPEGVVTEQYFSTFDKEIAESRKVKGSSLEELEGTQIWKGVFCADVLLEHGAIDGQIPNQKHFPLIPLCLKRNYLSIPYGVVDGLIPLSTCLNYVWTKTIHGLNSKYLIIDEDNINLEKMRPILRDELNRRDGMIFTKNPHQVQLINSETLLPFLERTLTRIDLEFEQRTQLFDELKGEQTNAVSGVAIQARAVNAARTQNPLHATYEHMLFSEGQLILDTIRGIKNLQYAFNYYKDNKFNQGYLSDEISTINFEIFADFTPNFATSHEEEAAKFEALLNSPNPAFILSEPLFLKKLGFTESDSYALNEAFIKMMQGQGNQTEGEIKEEIPNNQQNVR
jgi:hypothetical protein